MIGIGAGYIGSFMVLRRMSLVGDALSHVALPGLAIALMFHINPFLGAFAALLVAVIGIWFLEGNTALPTETLVGIFFTAALAIGILITPEAELLEALFGNIAKVSVTDIWIALPIIIALMTTTKYLSRTLTLGTISKELTQSLGININAVNLVFLVMVATVVALGIKITGTLLMGALVIIPAAAARNVTLNLSGYTWWSAIFGGLAGLIGVIIANSYNLSPGPIVVLAGGVIFLISLALKR